MNKKFKFRLIIYELSYKIIEKKKYASTSKNQKTRKLWMEYTRYFEGLQRDFWNAENKKVPARASKQPGINPRSEMN